MDVKSRPGLFSNMAFGVTFTTKAETRPSARQQPLDDKIAISRLIREHGGDALDDGLEVLFDLSSTPLGPTSTPPSSDKQPGDLTLTSASDKLGFVALITDTHSRREKYMQALALNIPCLSSRWVRDSIARGVLLPWDRYLLPAGESSLLYGAIRSRTLVNPAPDAASANLRQSIADRPRLLRDKSVLLVVGKGKGEERRRAYVFLTLALGARKVERVRDIDAAKGMLTNGGAAWDWVYVNDGGVEAACVQLLEGHEEQGKKRKRKSGLEVLVPTGALSATIEVEARDVRVVGDEFVVQSLILGALIEDA